ncbi:hypothetical protein [Actinokineospora sp. NPDC004072]
MCHPSWREARAFALRLAEFARQRRVRDQLDRDHARPLDVIAVARAAGMTAAHLVAWFRLAYGVSPYEYVLARRLRSAAIDSPIP